MATGTISEVRRADQLGALTDRQLGYAIVPAANDFTLSDLELEGLSAVAGRVEFGSVVKSA